MSGSSNPFQNRPLIPSQKTRIGGGQYITDDRLPMGEPTDDEPGVDVSNWEAVHVTFYADTGSDTNKIATVIPYRWYGELREGTTGGNVTKGRWVRDQAIDIALDASIVSVDLSQHFVWDTRDAEKMYWRIVNIRDNDTNAAATAPDWLVIQPFASKVSTAIVAVSGSASGGGGGGATAAFKDVLASGLDLYYTGTPDTQFSASYTSATKLTIVDGSANPLNVQESQIVAITRKVPGSETEMEIFYRGNGLDWDYDPTSGELTVDGIVFGATDILEVFFQADPRAHSVHGQDPQRISSDTEDYHFVDQMGAVAASTLPTAVNNTNAVSVLADKYGRLMPAAFQLASQSDRTEEVQPLNDKYVTEELVNNDDVEGDYTTAAYFPSSDGATMDSWKDLSFHIYLEGGQSTGPVDRTGLVNLEVSDGSELSGARIWRDVSLAGYVVDDDQTIRALGETALATSTGTTAEHRIVDFDELNVKYWRIKVGWDGAADSTNYGVVVIAVRRKAL